MWRGSTPSERRNGSSNTPSAAKSDAARSGSRIEARYSNSSAFESFIFVSFRQSERTNLVLPVHEAQWAVRTHWRARRLQGRGPPQQIIDQRPGRCLQLGQSSVDIAALVVSP